MENQFVSVMIGGDVGIYAMARSMYETYKVKTLVISSVPTASVSNSVFIDNVYIGDIFDEKKLLATLENISSEQPLVPKLLFVNIDPMVGFASKYRKELEKMGFLLPFPNDEVVETLSNKWEFAKACIAQEVNTPKTVLFDFKTNSYDSLSFKFPVVAKAAVNAPWHDVEFEGKEKVHFPESQSELDALVSKLENAGFKDKIVVQELIPGDDTTMRSVSLYVNKQGKVTFGCAAKVLINDHVPSAFGIPLAMIPYYDENLIAQATRLVGSVNYHGFANFDVKMDPESGEAKFLEINPRAGMNVYYVHAAGVSPAKHMVEDMVQNNNLAFEKPTKPVLYARLPVGLVKKYIKNPELLSEINALAKSKKIVNPLRAAYDNGLKRNYNTFAVYFNYRLKFAKYYPKVSETGY